jgi:anti-sigma factor RsiW
MTTPAPLTCQQVVELVTGYLEGGLDPQTAMLMNEHLSTCPGCDTYVEQIRQTINLLGAVTPDNLSPSTRDGLMEAFRDLRPPRG